MHKNTLAVAIGAIAVTLPLQLHAQGQKVDPAVSKVSSAYQAAVNAEDAKALAAVYTEDAVEMPPHEPMIRGRAAIQMYYEKQFAEADGKVMITPMESMASGNAGYEVGTYTQSMKMKTGQTMNDKGKYVVLLKPGVDKQWRVAYAIYNSDTPPQPAQASQRAR
jgi:uncharacterized protein (TIGR02246 family)